MGLVPWTWWQFDKVRTIHQNHHPSHVACWHCHAALVVPAAAAVPLLPQPATSCPLPPSLHTRNGVNLTKVVLPVELCEPRSFLSRLTDSWAYLDLLHAAAEARCVCVCVLQGRGGGSGWQWYMYACASWRGDKR